MIAAVLLLTILQAGGSNTLQYVLAVWAMIFFSLMFINVMLVVQVVYLARILKALGVRKK